MRTKILILLILTASVSYSQNTTVAYVMANQRTDGTGLVDISYALQGDGINYNIRCEVSFDEGENFTNIQPEYLTGTLDSINPGVQETIVWNAIASHPDMYTNQAKIKLIAYQESTGPITTCDCSVADYCDLFPMPTINPNWSVLSGNWNIVANEGLHGYWSISAAQTDQGLIFLNQSLYDPNDYLATTKVKCREENTVGYVGERFVLRNSVNNQILIAFNWVARSVVSHVRVNGAYYITITETANIEAFNTEFGDFNDYSVSKEGNLIKVYVNGVFVHEFIDTYFQGNTVFGLATYGHSYYTDFRICPANEN